MKYLITILLLFAYIYSFEQVKIVPTQYSNGQYGKALTLKPQVYKTPLAVDMSNVNADTVYIPAQSAWYILGNHTSSSAIPTFGLMDAHSINATGSTYNGTKYLRDDGTWQVVSAGSGTVTGTGLAQRMAIWNGTSSQTYSGFYTDTTKNWFGIGAAPSYVLDVKPTFNGTIALTNGSATVTGTNTDFTNKFQKGDSVYTGASFVGVVLSIASNTSLTLVSNYTGTTASGLAYSNFATNKGIIQQQDNGWILRYNRNFINAVPIYKNTSVGLDALWQNTGSNNTAFGYQSLMANAGGANNTAVGTSALTANTSGFGNTAVGFNALGSNTNKGGNTAVGNNAGFGIGNDDNTAIGYNVLFTAGTGTQNTGVGSTALNKNTGGSQNTGIGYGALTNNTNGTQNTGIGVSSLLANTTGNFNVAIGYNSLVKNTTGGNNIALGSSLANLTTGTNNNAFGNRVWDSLTTGVGNIGLGQDAGRVNGAATNTYSIMIGYATKPSGDAKTNEIVIGSGDGSGNVGMGSNTTKLGSSQTTDAYILGTTHSFGNIVAFATKTAAYTTTASDDFIPVDATSGAVTITLLSTAVQGQTYTIKKIDNSANSVTVAGTIDGATNYSLGSQWKYIELTKSATGSNTWYIKANN